MLNKSQYRPKHPDSPPVHVDDLPDVECQDCWWQGDALELDDGHCPECGSDDICDYEPD